MKLTKSVFIFHILTFGNKAISYIVLITITDDTVPI